MHCEPLCWVKVRQTTNKIFERWLNVLPQRERLTRVGRVEAVAKNFEDVAPRTVAEMLQEPIQSVLVRKI